MRKKRKSKAEKVPETVPLPSYKERLAVFDLSDDALKSFVKLLDGGSVHTIAIEPSIREFLEDGDAISGEFIVFKYDSEVNGEKAIRYIEATPALMEVLTHMRDILVTNARIKECPLLELSNSQTPSVS